MLDDHGIEFEYREYRKQPLSERELKSVLKKLGVKARDVLRTRDKAFGELGLIGSESDAKLIPLMARHPTLLQRPIGVKGNKAAVGRPPEALLKL